MGGSAIQKRRPSRAESSGENLVVLSRNKILGFQMIFFFFLGHVTDSQFRC